MDCSSKSIHFIHIKFQQLGWKPFEFIARFASNNSKARRIIRSTRDANEKDLFCHSQSSERASERIVAINECNFQLQERAKWASMSKQASWAVQHESARSYRLLDTCLFCQGILLKRHQIKIRKSLSWFSAQCLVFIGKRTSRTYTRASMSSTRGGGRIHPSCPLFFFN